MNDKVEILPEDRIKLTQDQKNLIELAFVRQVPPEDAELIEMVKKEAKKEANPISRLSEYFITKYGFDFGTIYLSAIMGGREEYDEAVHVIEKSKAQKRLENIQKN